MARWVELRRHSFTKKGEAKVRGSHLSQRGVDAARAEGSLLRHVRYVAASREPRTLETALAMGFAVDDLAEIDSSTISGEVTFHEWWGWPNPWSVFRERMDTRPALAVVAASQLEIVKDAVGRIDDGETALLIGHGGWIEPTVVAAVDRADLRDWGPSFDHLEGVRLSFERGKFAVERIHRRPEVEG